MPNWIEGSLKIRGHRDDILRFFREGLECWSYGKDGSNMPVDQSKWLNIHPLIEEDPNGEIIISLDYSEVASRWLYIKGTRRAFITDVEYDIYLPEVKEDSTDIVLALPVVQAWGFRLNNWVELAQKFNLDFRLYGIEQGTGFSEEIEIARDGVVENYISSQYENHDDFVWNCPFPWMGG